MENTFVKARLILIGCELNPLRTFRSMKSEANRIESRSSRSMPAQRREYSKQQRTRTWRSHGHVRYGWIRRHRSALTCFWMEYNIRCSCIVTIFIIFTSWKCLTRFQRFSYLLFSLDHYKFAILLNPII